MSTFSKIPEELILQVFQYLPIPSLHVVSQLSRDWYDFCSRNQSTIYHQAALLHRFVPNLTITLTEAKEKFSGHYLKGDTNWRAFCHHLFKLNQNWAGQGSAIFRMSSTSGICVHRIKVDEQAGFLITTHMTGGIKVVDLATDTLLWHLPEAYVRSWAHCEYQNGFLIFDRFGEFKEVWRLSTDFHLSPPPITHQPDALQVNVSNAVADHYCGRSERGQFKPWALLQTPEWGRAFRFVYPILLVSAMNRAYLYDVESANLVQTIQDTQMNIDGIPLGDINYVEINDSLVIICGTEELRAFHRSNGAVAFRIPPKLPASVPRVGVEVGSSFDAGHNNLTPLSFVSMQRRAAELTSKFVGAHVHGRDLVALLLDDRILLIRDFISLIKGEKQLFEAALEVGFSEPPTSEQDVQRRSIYVAFEHGHVGVITSSGLFVLSIDGARHGVVDPDTEHTTSCLQGTAFPRLIGTRVAHINDPQDLYQVVSCLQLAESGLYVTLDHRFIPPLSKKGKRRSSLVYPDFGIENMDEGDADIVEDGPAAPVEDIDEIGATSASTADDARSMLMSLLHPQQGGLTDDSDDDPITIHTAHVNTEDEDQFYDEDEDEFWVDGPDDIEGEPESHSVVWIDCSPS